MQRQTAWLMPSTGKVSIRAPENQVHKPIPAHQECWCAVVDSRSVCVADATISRSPLLRGAAVVCFGCPKRQPQLANVGHPPSSTATASQYRGSG